MWRIENKNGKIIGNNREDRRRKHSRIEWKGGVMRKREGIGKEGER